MSEYVGLVVAEADTGYRILFELPPYTHIGEKHRILYDGRDFTPVMDSITESVKYDEDWFTLLEKLCGTKYSVRPDAVYSRMRLNYPDEPEAEE